MADQTRIVIVDDHPFVREGLKQLLAGQNEFLLASGELAATVRSTGGWLDLRARKLVPPPPALLSAFSQVPRAQSYTELPLKGQE